MIILANILSGLGALCLAYSSFAKQKNDMMLFQLLDYAFLIASNLLLGGYSGAVVVGISVIRNILVMRGRLSKPLSLFFVTLQIGLGLAVNQLSWIGILPIIASVSYTLALSWTSQIQVLRWFIVENMLLWLIYDITIQAYPAALMDMIIAITSLLAIYKHHVMTRQKTNHQ